MQNSTFKIGYYILLQHDLYNPLFGKVIDIVTYDSVVIICFENYHSTVFYSHYNSFVIVGQGTFSALDVSKLFDHRPLYSRYSFSPSDKSLYISLPYIY